MSHVSIKFWVFEKYWMLKQRRKAEDYGKCVLIHVNAKKWHLLAPDDAQKLRRKSSAKGKWKCVHAYLSGFSFSLEDSGYMEILAISRSKGWDLWLTEGPISTDDQFWRSWNNPNMFVTMTKLSVMNLVIQKQLKLMAVVSYIAMESSLEH